MDGAAALKEAMDGVDGVHISLKDGPEADFDRMDHLAVRDIANIAKREKRCWSHSFRHMPSARKRLIRRSRSKLKGEAAQIQRRAAHHLPRLAGSWRHCRYSFKAKVFR
ncbi:MAG: hypothetical protein U0Z26_13395 [Anaerolineales bacterium]